MTAAVDNGTGYYLKKKKPKIKSCRLSSYDIDLTEANEKPQGSVSFSITLRTLGSRVVVREAWSTGLEWSLAAEGQ